MDLPGFYFDAERNRYFPVSSRNTQGRRQSEAEQSPEIAKVQRGSSPNVETRVLQLLERREIGCNLNLENLSSPNIFQRHCMETLGLQPWIWSYFENGVERADGAVEEIHAEIQTTEGLKGSDILVTGRDNALGMCEILQSKEVGEARFPPICPQRLFPPYSSKFEERSCSSNERPPHLSQCATYLHFQSKVTAIKRRTCNDVILTTLGSAREGGALHILKQNQAVADNWRHGQHLPFSIFRSAVTDSSVWTTACCGHAKAALGTSRGAMLVDLESLSNKWLFRSKSDILSQECDSSGNILFCGFRNGRISTVDIRARPQRTLMNPPRNFRRVKLQPETSSRKGGNSETWSHTSPINMDSAVCSMILLHSDESYLLASAMNGDIELWDRRLIGKGSVLKYEGNYNTHSMLQLWIDASDLLLASGGEDCAIRIWSLRSGKLLQTLSGLPSVITRFSSPIDEGSSKLFQPSCLVRESTAQDHAWGTWMGSATGVYYMHGAATNIC